MNSIHAALGFAMRAGRAACGDFSVEKSVSCGKAKVIVIDAEASPSTKKKWLEIGKRKGIPTITVENAGHAVGKDGRMVIAITDTVFSEMIMKINDGRSAESE